MYAVVSSGGKQYRVEAGNELILERVPGDAGASITFDRVLLIGDAAHACPPMLAQGAAMATEDGAVLGELLGQDHDVETLLDLFMQRRRARAEMVVENSVQLARWELEPDTPGADPAALMGASMGILAQPF